MAKRYSFPGQWPDLHSITSLSFISLVAQDGFMSGLAGSAVSDTICANFFVVTCAEHCRQYIEEAEGVEGDMLPTTDIRRDIYTFQTLY